MRERSVQATKTKNHLPIGNRYNISIYKEQDLIHIFYISSEIFVIYSNARIEVKLDNQWNKKKNKINKTFPPKI